MIVRKLGLVAMLIAFVACANAPSSSSLSVVEFARGCWIARQSESIVETLRLLPDSEAPDFYTGTQLRYELGQTTIIATWRLARDGSEIWRLDRHLVYRYRALPSVSGALRFEYDSTHDLVVAADNENIRISPNLKPSSPAGALNLQNLGLFNGVRDGCD